MNIIAKTAWLKVTGVDVCACVGVLWLLRDVVVSLYCGAFLRNEILTFVILQYRNIFEVFREHSHWFMKSK